MFKLITIGLAGLLVLACSPQVSSNPTRTSTVSPAATTTPAATSTTVPTAAATPSVAPTGAAACQNTYLAGDTPIVAPRKAGQHLEVALDAVRPGASGGNRWFVRFFVPAGSPGTAEIPLRASITGPAGALQTGAYEAGPPNAGTAPATQPLTVQPCSAAAPPGPLRGVVLVGVQTEPVRSGTYTLTWSDISLPEGGTRTETWTVTLTCTAASGSPGAPATECK